MGNRKFKKIKADQVRPEELSSNEHGGLFPFYCDLAVELYMGAEPIHYRSYFRAPDLGAAQAAAFQAFEYFEHERNGLTEMDYPAISNKYRSKLIGLTEDQYKEFWKEAQKANWCVHVGHKKNPTWFRFEDDADWSDPKHLLNLREKGMTKKILLPGT